ncbi:mycofactocin system transcriptional regulator [Leucobacter sp. wl10]|uniref:mycofactocin system transcriptional regulator n=1 Tax=Leucobacter sp. wl10 TaxID=2304677 RepID=UPI0019691556|nr:mycofactocin system transcriptional regulator [Leucobacter sp. wl10]
MKLEPEAAVHAPETQRAGRARATSAGELSHIALDLFFEHGFDETTVTDIARAAGIGRRTVFRYFPSKNDLAWGEFETMLESMRSHLATLPEDMPLQAALRDAIIEFNRFPDDELHYHRERMRLLLNVPSLAAHSTLKYAAWREVVAEYVALRRHERPTDLVPRASAWICLGVCLSAYEQWLAADDADLLELIDRAFATTDGFGSAAAAESRAQRP